MKKSRTIVVTAAIIAAVLAATVLAGCGSEPQKNAPQESKPEGLSAKQVSVEELDKLYSQGISQFLSPERTKDVTLSEVEEWIQKFIQESEKEFGQRAVARWQAERRTKEAPTAQDIVRWAADDKARRELPAAIAAANARGVTAADFEYDLTSDGKGINIKGYKGWATIVNIPAVIEGFPVMEVSGWGSSSRPITRDSYIPIFIDVTSVTIPDSVTSMGSSVFSHVTSLQNVTLPRNLKEIPYRTFSKCTSLQNITLPTGITSIGEEAFAESGITSITLPNGVKGIAGEAFKDCTQLQSVTLPNGITWIGESAFEGCTSLKSIAIPASVKTIEKSAFKSSGLTSVVLPTVTLKSHKDGYISDVKGGVFKDCKSLASVTVSGDIGEYTFSGERENR